jgi:hypothetical protein
MDEIRGLHIRAFIALLWRFLYTYTRTQNTTLVGVVGELCFCSVISEGLMDVH